MKFKLFGYQLMSKIERISINETFKYIGIVNVLISFSILWMNKTYYIFTYDATVISKIAIALMFLSGLFYWLFIDTKNFQTGSIGFMLSEDVKASIIELKLPLAKMLIIRKKNTKYTQIEATEIDLKSQLVIESELDAAPKLFDLNKDEIIGILTKEKKDFKIPFVCKNEKNIFIYTPMFDFLDKIIEGGIYALYGKARNNLFRYIMRNFTKDDEEFDFNNLRKRYSEWLRSKKTNSDMYLDMNKAFNLVRI